MFLPIHKNQHRLQLYDYLQKVIELSQVEQRKIAILLVKIDGLSNLEINSDFEHVELVSKKVLARIISLVSNPELVIQISMDTFVVILPKALNASHLNIVGLRIVNLIKQKITIDENETCVLYASVGASLAKEQSTGESLFKNALIALEESQLGTQLVTVYDDLSIHIKKKWDLKKDIGLALHHDQFELYFQPKIDLVTNRVYGAEALIRWKHPEHGMIPPDEFIPISESTGQIQAITEWVIKSGISQLASFLELDPEFKLALNISVNNLASQDLLILLQDCLSIWNVSPKNLILEVTETAIMTDAESSLHLLSSLRKMGLGVSIDDFGTGYSSLAYFKEIPATEIKIDRSFVDKVISNSQDETIISLIILLAKEFDLTLVAEGIETKKVLERITTLGCDYGQGYYFTKPLEFNNFIKWYQSYNK